MPATTTYHHTSGHRVEWVLLWTGMFTKLQRAALHPYIQRLPLARSRALLSGTCRSFASATRSI